MRCPEDRRGHDDEVAALYRKAAGDREDEEPGQGERRAEPDPRGGTTPQEDAGHGHEGHVEARDEAGLAGVRVLHAELLQVGRDAEHRAGYQGWLQGGHDGRAARTP